MKKVDNFLSAFANLRDIYVYEAPYGNVELAGLTGLFEICFEQARKAMKEYLQEQGFDEASTGSPRQVLKTAYASGLIEDEQAWIDALADRNNVARAYNEDVALGIIENTRDKHYLLFEQLKDKFEREAVVGAESTSASSRVSREKRDAMYTAALQRELNQSVQGLPDSSIRLLIEVAKSMTPAAVVGSSDGMRPAASCVDKRIAGVFPGEVAIADDFDETPECFKEYCHA